jgi:hypothetical protein
MNPAYILSALSLGLCVFFFFYFRAFLKRRTAAEELLAEYRTEVYRLIAEIDTATDRDSRLVEERIKTLKALLEDTDKRIAVYLRELDRSRSGEALYASLGKGIRKGIPADGPGGDSRTILDSQPAAAPQAIGQPELEQPALIAGTVSPQVETLPERKKPAPSQAAAPSQFRAQVASLAAEGLSPAEIASRLGSSLSEVDLALNLLTMKTGKPRT